ncbi:MAG: alpha-amylase family glycosyl hydrolase [Candidatus Euphemobacter frigidus]|nr:alpha-amylase family glycosyl hydrolase [Candidatus Euphemobacter frigidus]MDP8276210.1 alpha-amylase family glycosyl hydrolase [Candidatus Euphemobacter frigidus]
MSNNRDKYRRAGARNEIKPGADPAAPFMIASRARNYYGRPAGEKDVIDVGQLLAEKINERRDVLTHPELSVRAGEVNAITLIDKIFHYLVERYRRSTAPRVQEEAVTALQEQVGRDPLNQTLVRFIEDLPGLTIIPEGVAAPEYLRERTPGTPRRRVAANELLMLSLANRNPAFKPLAELFNERELKKTTAYPELISALHDFYRKTPPFGPENLPLPEFLQAPVRSAPDSLSGQLGYIKKNWSHLLNPELLNTLLITRDIIREEKKLRVSGGGPVMPPVWTNGTDNERRADEYRERPGTREAYERFSPDLDWMPRVVLMVKNTYVWLDQLSKRYRRRISRLDQIPDEELNRLARWGFTGFWLIGLWERSPSSRKIKRACGNPEADASAYSLYDYVIAADLGGETALNDLKSRAWRRGIRMSSDMVPNHMGIYSKWVIEHPDWFVRTPRSPFPGYRFTGENMSGDPRLEIYLEDGYWQRSDAAVVFKRVNRETGEICYIYHGNDGTSMPWNDTAQLNFLRVEVREAVIQTILHVARSFPIIRFDAAMILTKQHFQRLWYPPPGEGGAIPSRAGRGVSSREFNRLFPREFWREVVDRVATEVPDTLLLAEAFWMLEGYFVRSLGMHRVYNSAFMNMLKLEMNAQYRQVIKEILEFDPQILKRFVNFMNNPDEATAVAQFGKGDKYFGVCTMMMTMPGLPLFGHGQIEGLAERYGMEYRKAYWDEPVDGYLVKRHEEEIFPLMKKRHLFSDVTNFYLYDFYRENGTVNEDVFAYSNRYENERSLIVYNNRFRNTNGWIRLSSARSETGGGKRKKLVQVDISRGLGLRAEDNDYTIFKDLRTALEYIRSSREIREKGFYLLLRAYQTHVFADLREVKDDAQGFLARLCSSLEGRGVDNINQALKKVRFASLYRAFQELFNPAIFRSLFEIEGRSDKVAVFAERVGERLTPPLEGFFTEVLNLRGRPRDVWEEVEDQVGYLTALSLLASSERLPSWTSSRYSRPALRYLFSKIPKALDESLGFFRVIFSWSLLRAAAEMISKGRKRKAGSEWMREWFLGEQVLSFFQELGCDWETARRELSLITILLRHVHRLKKVTTKNHLYLLEPVFKDSEVRRFLLFHWFNDTLWFNRERLEELLYWLTATATVIKSVQVWKGEDAPRVKGLVYSRAVGRLLELAARSGYRVKEFRKLLAAQPRKRRRKKKIL